MKDKDLFRKWKMKALSLGVIILVVGLVILVNYVFEGMEDKYAWTLDLSGNQQFSISQETKDVVKALEEDVHIYTLYSESTASTQRQLMEEILKRYEALGHVTVENLDMMANPALVSRFRNENTQLSVNSIIVANGDESKFRVIHQSELYDYEMDYQNQSYTKFDFVGEQAVTSAILYVTSAKTPAVYFLQGHGEMALSSLRYVADGLRARNFEPRELHLSDADAPLEKDAVVMVIAPTKDLSQMEYEQLKGFLEQGGKLYYASNYVSGALENFDLLLSLYGLEVDKGLLLEDAGYVEYYYRNQLYLMPDILGEAASDRLDVMAGFEAGDYVVLPQSQAVRTTQMRDVGVEYANVLTTSPKAYIKNQLTQTSQLAREAQDESGTFNVAVAMVKTHADGSDTRIFAVGNALFLLDNNMFSAYDNGKLLYSPIAWLMGEDSPVQVPGKSMGSYRLNLPGNTLYQALCILVMGVIPGIVLVIGLIVWRRRRHL